MSSERVGRIEFSENKRAVYIFRADDDASGKTAAAETPAVHKAGLLGEGGMARVYKIPAGAFPAPVAIKRYSESVLQKNRSALGPFLRSLIDFRKELPDNARHIMDQCTTWPQRLVYDYGSDNVCGFTMQLIPEMFFSRVNVSDYEETHESNLDFVLQGSDFRRAHGLPALTKQGAARVIYGLMQIVSVLHSYDYVLGDMSPKNTLIRVDGIDQSRNRVLLIDTDSYRKKGSVNPLRQSHTPDWIPPECMKAAFELEKLTISANPNQFAKLELEKFVQNQRTDIYKLCLAITRLYHVGGFASMIQSSDSAADRLCREIGEEFAKYVSLGLSEKPEDRPTVGDMLECFRKSLQSKRRK